MPIEPQPATLPSPALRALLSARPGADAANTTRRYPFTGNRLIQHGLRLAAALTFAPWPGALR